MEIDPEDKKRIHMLKREKQERRAKLILTMNTTNFNLFKPSSMKTRPLDINPYGGAPIHT